MKFHSLACNSHRDPASRSRHAGTLLITNLMACNSHTVAASRCHHAGTLLIKILFYFGSVLISQKPRSTFIENVTAKFKKTSQPAPGRELGREPGREPGPALNQSVTILQLIP